MTQAGAAVDDGWLETIIAEKSQEAEGIVRLALRPATGAALPAFEAGAHIEIALPNGVTRPYSLCNAPHDGGGYEIAVLLERAGRGGSRSVHEDLAAGQALKVRRPRNLFPLASDGFSLLVAGGIGVTPLLAMAESLHRQGRGFTLHICARSAARAAFRHRLACAPFAAQVVWHFDDGAPAQAFDIGAALAAAPEASRLYVCGPGSFMAHVLGAARAAHWPETRLHYEYFSAAPPAAGDSGFALVLARSGRTIVVGPQQTAAQAMSEAGIEPRLSCEQGVCGTCLLQVIEGVPDHRDHFQSKAEKAANRLFAPCCSRAHTPRLVIDF